MVSVVSMCHYSSRKMNMLQHAHTQAMKCLWKLCQASQVLQSLSHIFIRNWSPYKNMGAQNGTPIRKLAAFVQILELYMTTRNKL
jgi:hypothetical protein